MAKTDKRMRDKVRVGETVYDRRKLRKSIWRGIIALIVVSVGIGVVLFRCLARLYSEPGRCTFCGSRSIYYREKDGFSGIVCRRCGIVVEMGYYIDE